MKAFIAASLIALTLGAFALHSYTTPSLSSTQLFSQKLASIADIVNSSNTTWKAGYNAKWENQSEESFKSFIMDSKFIDPSNNPRDQLFSHSEANINSAPASFDARTNWSNCESISEVRDQSSCGSCWAFGAAEAMSDRVCIASGQTDQRRVSAEDLLECAGMMYGNMGCNGGQLSGAFNYWHRNGLVDGGLYNDTTTCKPYKFAACAHHVTSDVYPDCPSTEYSTPSCKRDCSLGNGADYTGSKIHASSVNHVSGEANMMAEISQNGPVEVAFTVYADFPTYKSGVYQHTTGGQLGGHAVRALGYGTENGVKYWIIANSWNETWGDHGFFKILRGSNHCGIEDSGWFGAPIL